MRGSDLSGPPSTRDYAQDTRMVMQWAEIDQLRQRLVSTLALADTLTTTLIAVSSQLAQLVQKAADLAAKQADLEQKQTATEQKQGVVEIELSKRKIVTIGVDGVLKPGTGLLGLGL